MLFYYKSDSPKKFRNDFQKKLKIVPDFDLDCSCSIKPRKAASNLPELTGNQSAIAFSAFSDKIDNY
jgi:hypothetical protein